MPAPGPVAYQRQSGFLTEDVISIGVDQVAPSSLLLISHTVRLAAVTPSTISASLGPPGLRVSSRKIAPLLRSTTMAGLPVVFPPSSSITCNGVHVVPLSKLRFITRSMSPLSPRPFLRPSQTAITVPFGVTIKDGMRKVWYPSLPASKTLTRAGPSIGRACVGARRRSNSTIVVMECVGHRRLEYDRVDGP